MSSNTKGTKIPSKLVDSLYPIPGCYMIYKEVCNYIYGKNNDLKKTTIDLIPFYLVYIKRCLKYTHQHQIFWVITRLLDNRCYRTTPLW